MHVVLFLLILAATMAFVGWPLLEPALAGAAPSKRDLRHGDLVEEKERLLSALRDLEHDHGTGKIDDADHAAMSQKLKLEAARVLQEIDAVEAERPAYVAPEPPRAAPAASAEARFCTKCGRAAKAADAFCGRCGAKIE